MQSFASSPSEPLLEEWSLPIPHVHSLQNFANYLTSFLGPDQTLCLSGDLGTGKTTFARALLRSLMQDPNLEVPSPTFTLFQTYTGKSFPIVHADFFRIEHESELETLGWKEETRGALTLIEWPENILSLLPSHRLEILFNFDPHHGETGRVLTLRGLGPSAKSIRHLKALYHFLRTHEWSDAQCLALAGDASGRSYKRLIHQEIQTSLTRTCLLMISIPSDEISSKNSNHYAQAAHLARDNRPFFILAQGLRDHALSAPHIFAWDETLNFALIEDLGCDSLLTPEGHPLEERYGEATKVLAYLHTSPLPTHLETKGLGSYDLPSYDLQAFHTELSLFIEWYLPYEHKVFLSQKESHEFHDIWEKALLPCLTGPFSEPSTWVLRDYHSPNLLWLKERKGLARIGLLDFQDGLWGPPAYDLVSLLQDARVDISQDLEDKLFSIYVQARQAYQKPSQPTVTPTALSVSYALLGAQRATKILGIFTRLRERDHKPQYHLHMPRVRRALFKNLQHSYLADLHLWYQKHSPDFHLS